ncbi:hypothetical protein F4775DRAFT_9102 [Biscogniauxia sp. FL1348]|nr:hypothetical protein F4775DRAFT_9102 [Biscogniauxia sp. FL1348]
MYKKKSEERERETFQAFSYATKKGKEKKKREKKGRRLENLLVTFFFFQSFYSVTRNSVHLLEIYILFRRFFFLVFFFRTRYSCSTLIVPGLLRFSLTHATTHCHYLIATLRNTHVPVPFRIRTSTSHPSSSTSRWEFRVLTCHHTSIRFFFVVVCFVLFYFISLFPLVVHIHTLPTTPRRSSYMFWILSILSWSKPAHFH